MGKKISQLSQDTVPALTDSIPSYDSTSTPRIVLSDLARLMMQGHYGPQGYLLNGYISRTVSSNNITVAIKTLAGTDPTASNPVMCRIGNTLRTITSALSVTKNAGTNWMNLGAADHATQDVDLFAYLGYNATDGVVIGFSRIPYARVYGDFSATSTNDKYCAISTITNAASTDEYEVIGRFNATLSASASYNWSVPGTSIIINRPIYETRWLSYTPTLTNITIGNGTLANTYQVNGRNVGLIVSVTLGSTSSMGTNPEVAWPITPYSYPTNTDLGIVMLQDEGTASYTGAFLYGSNLRVFNNGAAGTSLSISTITSLVPHTWANTDYIRGKVEYRLV